MSSISPIATKHFASRINQLRCDYLDAPVSGGGVGARAASLTIMVGGPKAAFQKVRPLLELMGRNIILVGGNGDGQTTKVANQIIVSLTIEVVTLLFTSRIDSDPAKVCQALMDGLASSCFLEVRGERMVKRNFDPSFAIARHQTDLNLALARARELGIRLPNISAYDIIEKPISDGKPRYGVERALEQSRDFEQAVRLARNRSQPRCWPHRATAPDHGNGARRPAQ